MTKREAEERSLWSLYLAEIKKPTDLEQSRLEKQRERRGTKGQRSRQAARWNHETVFSTQGCRGKGQEQGQASGELSTKGPPLDNGGRGGSGEKRWCPWCSFHEPGLEVSFVPEPFTCPS